MSTVALKSISLKLKGLGELLEDWSQALDKDHYAAAIIMDLSKAFDCLPHDILLSKLSAYESRDTKTSPTTSLESTDCNNNRDVSDDIGLNDAFLTI
ncbi:hypothetical protein DPMN_099794 [Dreissena polymorpha]|uniref:Reverse transcriptase domain-containing protein n=1 Tax=Dreissena polymorpha TaxID=45954 RepID=A0A9D4R6R9_DREPO|nr:hypothetical protein DPMN_099794 [Dreissena polymorpha]